MSAVRDTGAAAYRDGVPLVPAGEPRIVDGGEVRRSRVVDADVCVIGSGAGGAPVAKELAEGGMSVVTLEEGGWFGSDAMLARPREMTPRLYRDAGQIVTVGTPPIPLPLGRGVGGTTLVNSGTCFRTPAGVLERWRSDFGLEAYGEEELEGYFRRVERLLNVSQVPAEIAGANAAVVRRGVEALGWSGDYLYRNVRGCVGSGVCAYGCPTGAKQHVGISFMPHAWAAGAVTYTHARAQRLLRSGRRVTGVVASCGGGGALEVRAPLVVVACGAIHTPLFLRGQGVGLHSGQLGRNLSIHPATAVRARMDDVVDMWDGVPQSYYVDELVSDGVMLEGIAGPPDHIAMSTPRIGAEHARMMADARMWSMFGVMVADGPHGRVDAAGGRPLIRYALGAEEVRRFRSGLEALCEIYWAAGAQEIVVPVRGVGSLTNGDSSPLRRARVGAGDLSVMGFHPLGTARAGADPAWAVVDGDLRVHGVEGLMVCDGSAVPSSPGVNPQITIMALATRAAFGVLGAGAPGDEPAPAHIARVLPLARVAHSPA